MSDMRCEKCGKPAPDGLGVCPACALESSAWESGLAAELADIMNILNMSDTEQSQRAAIKSLINIKNRLEAREIEKEKAKVQT